MTVFRPDRRRFLKITAASLGSGLSLGICWSELSADPSSSASNFQPNAWLRIDHQGLATLYVAESEMGQGVYTALPMLIAEELEIDWLEIKLAHASLDPAYGFQGTGGSRSVRKAWKTLREAGAIARHMLISAAANQLEVAEDECFARESRVIHRPSQQAKRVFDLMKDFGTSKSTKIDSIFDSLLVP
ncbi:MAG: molybdopterin cofactor-binding domain-containing protein, partial [Candidatus Thiodiazotropha sp.]